LASVAVGLIPSLGNVILSVLVQLFSDLRLAALLGGIALFFIPSTLLGMVLPFLIRLKIESVETSDRTVGKLYALSTLGSIVGTFGSGFFLSSY
jgi:hypothetical protein